MTMLSTVNILIIESKMAKLECFVFATDSLNLIQESGQNGNDLKSKPYSML